MFADQPNDKMAVTKDMLLSAGDIIQFRVRECKSMRKTRITIYESYEH